MRSHISIHRATAKYFSNSFVFKPNVEKEGPPGDSPAACQRKRSRVCVTSLTANYPSVLKYRELITTGIESLLDRLPIMKYKSYIRTVATQGPGFIDCSTDHLSSESLS